MAFLKVLQKGKVQHWLCYTLFMVLLLYAHYYAFFVIFSQIVFLFAMLIPKIQGASFLRREVKHLLFVELAIAITLALICFAPWVVFGIKTIYGYQPAPEAFGWGLISRLIKELSDRSYPLSFMLIILAACGMRRLLLRRQYGHLSFLLCWGLLPLPLIFLLLWIKEYFFAIRQILFMTPVLYILVAIGIMYLAESCAGLHQRARFKVAALITACLVVTSSIVIWLHIPDRNPDLKTAGQFLRQNILPGNKVVAPNLVGVLGYYFPEIHEYALDNSALSDASRSIVPGQRIFVVESQYMTDLDRNLIQEVMVDQSHFIEQSSDFRGVRVIKLQSH